MRLGMTKIIGIVGGVGPQATQYIYSNIIKYAQKRYGAHDNDDYPRVLIDSVPVPDFISNTNKIDSAKAMLIKSVQGMAKAGATRLCIASNTIHILLEELKASTDVPFISMVEQVANYCQLKNFRKVGLLGTPVLIHSQLYEHALTDYNIDIVRPTEDEIALSDKIIRSVLAGKTAHKHKQGYINALQNLFDRGSQAIILGCTELPLAINYEALGNRTISSDEILAKAVVDYYYSE